MFLSRCLWPYLRTDESKTKTDGRYAGNTLFSYPETMKNGRKKDQ